MKQTAVEFLVDNIHYLYSTKWDEIIDEAKAMEKEQIINAYDQDLYGGLSGYRKFDNGEQYYNETYGTKNI